MVDIAMCSRSDCPCKSTCFRYLAFPSERQSYLVIKDKILEDKCSRYWRCRNAKELKLMNKLNRDIFD